MFFGKFFPSGYLFLLFYLYLNLISLTYFNLVFLGKGQNVKNQNVESPKRTSKVQKEHRKSKKNIESLKRTSKIRTSKVIFRLSTLWSFLTP
jgi:hypothetical protein